MNLNKLDNPAWHSLNETHRLFSLGDNEIKFYTPHICAFGGINSENADLISFLNQHKELNSIFIIGEKPSTSIELIIEKELVCLQMICSDQIKVDQTEDIIHLNKTYEKELYELVNLVQPGYFEKNTSMMGDYYGIFKNDQLVAVTGERMKMFGFTEISAVVTHPDHTGKGFAKQLVTFTVNKTFEQNIVPYLHVAETNTNAIKLYEKLGFVARRNMSFWKMKRIA
jgi:ribosomal protein S18 acetylase RimI-like enzyme